MSRRKHRKNSSQLAQPFASPAKAENDKRFILLAAAITALALVLRIYNAGTQELWLDESVSFHISVLESGLADVLLNQNTPPLYYLLLRAWVDLAGDGEAGIRALSALSGTLAVCMTLWLGSMAFNRGVGLWSGLAAAVSPMHIYYSQEARAYALLTCLVILSYAALWHALQTNRWPGWAAFAVSAALALYTHYLAILSLVPTAFLVLVWSGPGRKVEIWRGYVAAVLGAAVLFAPWAFMRFAVHPVHGVDWIEHVWNQTTALALLESLELLGLGSEKGLTVINLKQYAEVVFPSSLRLLGLSILILLGSSFLLPWGDKALGIPWIEKRKTWLLIWLLFPLAALWSISFLRPIYIVGRYDMTAFPAYPLILGVGLAKISKIRNTGKYFVTILTLLFLGVVTAKLLLYYHAVDSTAEAHSLADTLDENVANGDVVVFTGLEGAPILYYLYRRGYEWKDGVCENRVRSRRFGCRMFPRKTEEHVGVYDSSHFAGSTEEVQREVRAFMEQLEGLHGKLWIVLYSVKFSPDNDPILPLPESRMMTELEIAGFEPRLFRRRLVVLRLKNGISTRATDPSDI